MDSALLLYNKQLHSLHDISYDSSRVFRLSSTAVAAGEEEGGGQYEVLVREMDAKVRKKALFNPPTVIQRAGALRPAATALLSTRRILLEKRATLLPPTPQEKWEKGEES